jgi:imidazolonepropionase-like amidohydrolase
MRKQLLFVVLVLTGSSLLADEATELRAARALFERNLNAIRSRDRAAYLATYLPTASFAAAGTEGLQRGFDRFAKSESPWPDTFEARALDLVRVAPGVVYGTYRYRVVYGTDEHSGISQRLFVDTPDGWKIAVTGALDAPPGTPAPPRAITGATLIDGRGGPPVANANVIVRGGKIDCAGTAAQCPLPEGVEVTQARGMWITPGLIDAHVHFGQTGWADGRPDAADVRSLYPYEKAQAELRDNPERFARSYVCSGVTAVFDVGGYPWSLQLGERFENDTRAPHVVAAGPLLSTLDFWLNLPGERQFIALTSEEAARNGVRYLAARNARAIKVWNIVTPDLPIATTRPFVAAAADEARKHSLPLIVHATGLAEAKESLRAGANVFVHNVVDRPLDEEFIDMAKKNGTIVIPTLTVFSGYVRLTRSIVERKPPVVDDPNGCVDPATLAKVVRSATLDPSLASAEQLAQGQARVDQVEKTSAANLMALVRAGIPVATGTDAGNPLTLHGPAIYGEMEAMQSAGMTPMQVITASTLNAARAMRLGDRIGSIEAGKEADLLLLEADPSASVKNFRRLHSVMRSGEMRTVEELSGIARAAP